MNNLTRFFLGLMLLLFGSSNASIAQVCQYDFDNTFIIHVHEAGEEKEAKGVDVTLVDAEKKPVCDTYYIYDGPKYKFTHIDDCATLKVEYKFTKASSYKHHGKPLFPRANDYHICLIPKHQNSASLPPVYFARVIWKGDTIFHHLPYERSLDVCSHHLTSKDKSQTLPPMRQENRDVFAPIEIILGQQPIAEETQFPIKSVYFVLDLDTFETEPLGLPDVSLSKIEIHDYQTTNLIQTIHLRKLIFYDWSQISDLFSKYDTNTNSVNPLPSFKIRTEERYDFELKRKDIRYLHYRFDSLSQQYELDTLLSNYFNVTAGNNGQPSKRFHIGLNDEYKITTEFIVQNGQWIVSNQTKTPLVPDPKTIIKDYARCLSIKGSENHQLPAHLIPAERDKLKPILDTFELNNACYDTVFIPAFYNQRSREFTLSDSVILPKQSVQFSYLHQPPYLIWPIAEIEHQVVFDVKDGGRKNLKVSYHWIDLSKVDSSHLGDTAILFERPADDLLSHEQFITDTHLHPLAEGKALIETGEKVGDWRLHNKKGTQLEYQTVSKRMAFGLIPSDNNTSLSADSVVLQVRENGRWITPIYKHQDLSFWFYVRPNTDSIRFTHNDQIGLFTFDYESQRNETVHQLFMMSPQTEYFVSRGQKTPITFVDTAFVFRWNVNEFLKTQQYPIDHSKVLSEIQKLLPEASMNNFNLGTEDVLVSVSSENIEKLASLKSKLLNNKYVYAVYCSLEYLGQPTYNTTEFMAQFSSYIGQDSIRVIAAEFGFEVMNNYYQGNLVQLKHQRKVFDRAMLKDVNALSNHPAVWQVDPNLYFPVELDEFQDYEEELPIRED
jgi:hypothetical protein